MTERENDHVPDGTDASRQSVAPSSILRTQVRSSALLLFGRGCSLLLNLGTQIVIIRALSKTEFGALAYAFAVVELASLAATACADKTFARFGAMYHERQDGPRFVGALLTALSVPLSLGLACAALGTMFHRTFADALGSDAHIATLLLIQVWLVPLNGLSSVCHALFTLTEGGARTILMRRHLLGPMLKLGVVAAVVLAGGTAIHIAGALLFAGICGCVSDGLLLRRILARDECLRDATWRRASVSLREWSAYAASLFSGDAAFLARGSLIVALLGWMATQEATAAFRAALPIVKLNELVLLNFGAMFTPLAARLLARGERDHLGDFYRQSTIWVMVLSFPVFAASVALADPLCPLLFGRTYDDAATPVKILAAGYFLQAAFGFNARLMKVIGAVWSIAAVDIFAAATAVALSWALIPHYGANGAAWAVSAGIAAHTVMKSILLGRVIVIRPVTRAEAFAVAAVCCCSAVLMAAASLGPGGWLWGLTLAATTSLLVLMASFPALNAGQMFPELHKLPWIGHRIASGSVAGAVIRS